MSAGEQRFPHVRAGGGPTYRIIGELITFKVTAAESGDAFTVTELISQPGGGPPLHTHPAAEVFIIQEGAFEFTGLEDGERYTIRATPGDTVYIPGGAAHTYQCVGPTPGRAFGVLAPGSAMEHFFADVGSLVTDSSTPAGPAGPPSAAEIAEHMASAERHGIVFLPPADATARSGGATGVRHG